MNCRVSDDHTESYLSATRSQPSCSKRAKSSLAAFIWVPRSSEGPRCRDSGQHACQTKLGMDQLRSALSIFFINDYCNLDLRSGNQLDVDPAFSQAFEHTRCYSRMRSHSDANHAQLGQTGVSVQALGAHLANHRHQDCTSVFQFILMNRE